METDPKAFTGHYATRLSVTALVMLPEVLFESMAIITSFCMPKINEIYPKYGLLYQKVDWT